MGPSNRTKKDSRLLKKAVIFRQRHFCEESIHMEREVVYILERGQTCLKEWSPDSGFLLNVFSLGA